MRISTRAKYGLRFMLYLARHADEGHILLRDIAQAEKISEKYLSILVIPLKAKRLINSFRGAKGGFSLNRPADQIKIKEIVEPLEGDLSVVDSVKNTALNSKRDSIRASNFVWKSVGDRITEFLSSITLEDLKNMCLHGGAEYSI